MKVNQKDIEWLSRPPEQFRQSMFGKLDSENPKFSITKSRPDRKRTSSFGKLLFYIFAGAGIALLPLFLLIRGALYAWQNWELNAWLSLSLSAGCTVILLSFYVVLLVRWISGAWKFSKWIPRTTGFLILVYCCYTLFYISSLHTKTKEVRSHYLSLHPLLRVTTATLALFDDELIITDTKREAADYERMGLPANQNSLHFEQEDGFVHAIDLRTINRSAFQNAVLKFTYRAAGFKTLRHTGTADHLHVSVPQR